MRYLISRTFILLIALFQSPFLSQATDRYLKFVMNFDSYKSNRPGIDEFCDLHKSEIQKYLVYLINRHSLDDTRRCLTYSHIIEHVSVADEELVLAIEPLLASKDPILRSNSLRWLMTWEPKKNIGTCFQVFLTDEFERTAYDALSRIKYFDKELYVKYVDRWIANMSGIKRTEQFITAVKNQRKRVDLFGK